MAGKFNEDDDEYLELLGQYERYLQQSPGAYEDFDEWMEITYGNSKRKALKRNVRRNKDSDG